MTGEVPESMSDEDKGAPRTHASERLEELKLPSGSIALVGSSKTSSFVLDDMRRMKVRALRAITEGVVV